MPFCVIHVNNNVTTQVQRSPINRGSMVICWIINR